MIYEMDKLSFSYSQSKRPVFENVSLSVDAGDIVSLLGRNGAGKSTLLNCMMGLIKPQSGKLLLENKPVSSMKEKEIAKLVGYVPQMHTPAFPYTVLDFVMMGCAPKIGFFGKPGESERQDALSALEDMGIAELFDRPYTELSGGERQQATICRAIVSKPKAVLFDEPTAHLDYPNQLRVLRRIKSLARKGYAVVITTHNPDHALLLGGKAALFDYKGGLICGKAEDIITAKNLSAAYGSDVTLTWVEELSRMACVLTL